MTLVVNVRRTEIIKPASSPSSSPSFLPRPSSFISSSTTLPTEPSLLPPSSRPLCRGASSDSTPWPEGWPAIGRLQRPRSRVRRVESRIPIARSDTQSKHEEALTQLVPRRLTSTKSAAMEGALLAVQANFFDCGGLALGVDLCHCIGDMASFATFLKAWAATARNRSDAETDSEHRYHQLVRHGFHLFPPTTPSSAPPQYKFPARPDPVMKNRSMGVGGC